MSTSKTALSKIKRSPILGLLIMLCFIFASKVGASTLHKPEAYRIVSHEAQPRAIGFDLKDYYALAGAFLLQGRKKSLQEFLKAFFTRKRCYIKDNCSYY